MIGWVMRCNIAHVTLWNEQFSLDIPAYNQVKIVLAQAHRLHVNSIQQSTANRCVR